MKICAIGDSKSVHVQSRIYSVSAHDCSVTLFREFDIVESAQTSSFSALLKLIDDMNNVSADIVHIHYAANRSAWATLMLKDFPPVIVSVMGGDILDDEQTPLPFAARWMTRQLLKFSHVVTVKTSHMKQTVKSAGVVPTRIFDLMWGIDPYYFSKKNPTLTRKKMGFSENEWIIFSPRSLKPFYNHHLLLDAAHAIDADGVQIRIVFTAYNADQSYRLEIESLAQDYGLSNSIIFLDILNHEEMAGMYILSDVVVSLAPSDGFPQSVMEAMATGACCLVTRLERFSDILVDGKNAVMTGLTAVELKLNLEFILNAPTTRHQIEINAKTTANGIGTIDASAVKLKEIYADTLKQASYRPTAIIRLLVWAIFLMWTLRDMLYSGWHKKNRSER